MAKKENKNKTSPIRNTIKKVVKPKKKEVKPKLFEEKRGLAKLYLLIIVVDDVVSKNVVRLMQEIGSSMQLTHMGRGTANKEILNVLGATNDTKGVVEALIGEDLLEEANRELEIFFASSKRNRGVAISIPLSAITGVKIYKYLTQTI